MTTNADVTGMINAFARGDDSVKDELFARIHDTLKAMARKAARGGDNVFLETGVLLSELYLKIIDQEKADWSCRAQFFGFAARAMRRIRIDIARKELAKKRRRPPSAPAELASSKAPAADVALVEAERIVLVDAALKKLEHLHARQARVMEMRFFGQMTVSDTASVLGCGPRTVKSDTAMAIAWLHLEVGQLAEELQVQVPRHKPPYA